MHSSPPQPFHERLPLDGLDTIPIVARHGSLTAAAVELGLTHGTLSRRLASIEAWLGHPLFERHGRGVRPTPEGQRFIVRLEEALGIIEAASERRRQGRGPEIVRVSVLPSFAKLWLLPRLSRLEGSGGEGEPRLRIEIAIDHRFADLETGEVDLAVRYGRGNWPNVDACPLARETLHPIADRTIAERLGPRPEPARLLGETLLHDSDAAGWRAWFSNARLKLQTRPRDRRFEDYSLVLAAAEAGLGVALLRSPIAEEWLAARPRMARLGVHSVENPLGYYVVTRQREARPAVTTLRERLLAGQ